MIIFLMLFTLLKFRFEELNIFKSLIAIIMKKKCIKYNVNNYTYTSMKCLTICLEKT